jgi:hypothetical protein
VKVRPSGAASISHLACEGASKTTTSRAKGLRLFQGTDVERAPHPLPRFVQKLRQ